MNGQEDPYSWNHRYGNLFVQEFLEFYNKKVLPENECFDYESFYDFYLVYLNGIYNEELPKNKVLIEQFCADFNKKHSIPVSDSKIKQDAYNRVKDFNRTETFEKYTPNKRKVSIFLFLYKIRQNHC